ncbi:MAG: phosphotransferase [Planctomycetota bacterium]|nr:phosphotransferase [Planctomycetota bacterium]MDA1214309.1 phosphotransferase [Planctomycetota bacterium]
MKDDLYALSIMVGQRYSAGYAPKSITPIDSQQSFSGAKIYRVETAIGSFALRGWPPGQFPRHRIIGLHDLLEFLSERGIVQVAAPVRTISGETIWNDGHRDWHLEPWKPGNADFLVDPNSEKLQNAMISLADWHQAAVLWTPPRDSATWFSSSIAGPSSAITDRIMRIDYWSGAPQVELRRALSKEPESAWTESATIVLAHFDRLAAAARVDLHRLSQVQFSRQPCLRDLWSDHVLFTGNHVTGLIDPTACRNDNVAVDLARLLGSFLGDDEPRWQEALRTYHEHRPMSAVERELVRTLDRANVLLSAMTWLDRRFLNTVTIRHPDAALKRLKMYVGRIDHQTKTTTRVITP